MPAGLLVLIALGRQMPALVADDLPKAGELRWREPLLPLGPHVGEDSV